MMHQNPEAPLAADQLRDAMMDTETLGTKPGAAILSIGAVMFGPAGLGETFYAPVLLESCISVGLTIDPATVTWWMRQSDEARAAAFRPDAAPLWEVLGSFFDWFDVQRAKHPWYHGATFDAPILEAAFKVCGLAAPWEYWNVRDTRTLYDLAGVKVDRATGTHHNALDDAINQAKAAAQAMGILRDRQVVSVAAQVQADEATLYRDLTGDALALGYEGIPDALDALRGRPSPTSKDENGGAA